MNRLAALSGIVVASSFAAAGVPMSTFDITDGLVEISGFQDGGSDPLQINFLFLGGTYDLQLAEGVFDIQFSMNVNADIDGDDILEENLVVDPTVLGTAEVNAPFDTELSGSDIAPALPPFEINGSPVDFSGIQIDYVITTGNPALSGAFGAGAGLFLSLSGGDITGLEFFLQTLDGNEDDVLRAAFAGSAAVALVPAPAGLAVMGAGLAFAARRRR